MRRFIPFVLLLVSLASYSENNVVIDAQGVKYTINSDGATCNVSGYTDACSGAIVIPSTIEGKTVVAVNDYALAYSTQITSIVLPNSVRIIGEGAFMDDGTRSSTLESVTLPEGLEVIEGFAFEHCINLTTCNIPSTVEFIRQNAFFDVSLSNVTLPRSLKCLENQSFFVDGDVTFTCESPTPPEIDPQSFTDGLGFKGNYSLIVPKGCRDAYYNQSAWSSQFGSISESNTSVDPFPEPYTDAQGVEYTLIGSGDYQGTYFVSGHTNTCSGAVTIPATINGKTVSYIGHGAFKSLSGLTSVTIENGINSIRSNAFSGCSNLSSVVLPNSLTQIGNNSFANCSKLASVIIPSSVVRVDAHAFGSCEKLTSATLECNVSSLWTQVFNGCQDANFYLTTLTVSTVTPEVVARDVFYYLGSSKISNMTLIVPVGSISAYKAADYWKEFKSIQDTEGNTEDASVTSATINVATAGTLSTLISEANKNTITTLTLTGSLNGDDFRFIREMAGSDYHGVPTDGNLSTLDLSGATIVAGGSYVEIQDKKVYWNKEKTSYTSSSGVVDGEKVSEANKIGAYLFAGCQKLQTITLPNNLTAIDDFGFWATGLTAITMPNTVTSIGFDAFFACWYLASVTIPSSVTSINDSFLFCSGLESIIVDSKNSVYDSRDNCNALIETSSNTLLVGCKNTTIPNGIVIIGSAALANLNLTSITIPNSVTTIGNNAFGHNNLTTITIPSSVTSIANYAFQDNALQTVTVENPTPVAIYDDTFSNRANITLYVPSGCKAAYEAADYWKEFKEIIAKVEKDDVVYTPNDEDHTVTVSDGGESSSEIVIQSSISINGVSYDVTAIGDCAFQNNELVVKVTIPETIASIGSKAFAGCTNLKSIYIFVKTPINLPGAAASGTRGDGGSSVFAGVDTETCVLYVPAGSGDAYRNADGWKEFKEIVEMTSSASITVAHGMTTYTGEYNLDFSSLGDEVKAYVATGYDYDKNVIWLTRVKDVPAGTPIMVKAPAREEAYDVPVKASSGSYYKNMFVGNLSGGDITLASTTGDMTNYYLSEGVYKSVSGSAIIHDGRSYLQIPTVKPSASVGGGHKFTLSANMFSSYYGTQDLDFTNVEGLKAFTVTGYDDATGTIWLTRVHRVSGGTALLVVGNANGEYNVPSSGISSYYANMLKGNGGSEKLTIHTTDGDMTNYYLMNNMLLKVDGSAKIGPGKAYMQIPTKHVTRSVEDIVDNLIYGISADEPEIISIPLVSARGLDGDGDTTGIHSIENGELKIENDVYFNLQGQRVENPTKGIYLKNGKKVVIK